MLPYMKRDLADVIKNLEMGKLSWIAKIGSIQAQGVLMRWRQEGQSKER